MSKEKTDYELALKHKYRVESGGAVVPGVTTAIGIMDKPALKWASATIAAKTAIDHIDNLYEMASAYRETLLKSKKPENVALGTDGADEDVYAHWCRGEFDRVWREKASRGTRVHEVAERWVRGETVEVPLSDQGFVDALASFFGTHRPRVLMAEKVVINVLMEYGGRFDAIMQIDGKNYLIDFKTGGQYTLETAMQAAAYMNADLAIYEDDTLTGVEFLPELDGARIVYLREDGTFSLVDPFENISPEDAMRAFTAALDLYKITTHINKNLKETK